MIETLTVFEEDKNVSTKEVFNKKYYKNPLVNFKFPGNYF